MNSIKMIEENVATGFRPESLLENLDWKTFGNHRVTFYGDYRQKTKDLATLIGFEVAEKDK